MILAAAGASVSAREAVDDTIAPYQLKDVEVKSTRGIKSLSRVSNTDIIGQGQLQRAACCNLDESFTTNPSVDVSYADAATGARQIKLLGLSGTYVQMLTENVPNLRGAALPYSLGFVPGPWMQSIQVSKGASSVKNGYESITGQINIEFLKPQATDGIRGNVYLDSRLKLDANADANIHLTDKLSTGLLLHFENRQQAHDGNGDGFMDMPKLRQYNIMHRWAYVSQSVISQLSLRLLKDNREGGMAEHHASTDVGATPMPLYAINVVTNRYEAQWKNAYLFQDSRNSSIALMLHGSWHDADHTFGHTLYDVTQKNGYAQLMFESDITPSHSLAVGASVNHYYYGEQLSDNLQADALPSETTVGAYAQYTYKYGSKLTVMPGLRVDHSNHYGTFVTPRLHLRYAPAKVVTLRASAGKGYRSPHAIAENVTMLASGRAVSVADDLQREEAWNYGVSASLNIPIANRNIEINAEYYYTHFLHRMIVNIDGPKGPHTLSFENLAGKSYSHTLQVDATCEVFDGFTATAAFRYNDARATYDGVLSRQPLSSRYKGLLTLSYKTPLKLWHFDVTGHLVGSGLLYDRVTAYPTYFQLQAQVTRELRHFAIYAGGENLTAYKMKTPVISASDPWSPSFDATQVWGPTEGAMAYVGVRIKFEKL